MFNLNDYWKCMLKSTEYNPIFYSPSLTERVTDADGGVVTDFGAGRDVNDTRTRPQKIYTPPASAGTFEELPKFAYVNYNSDAVDGGAPRFLTESNYAKALASADLPADADAEDVDGDAELLD